MRIKIALDESSKMLYTESHEETTDEHSLDRGCKAALETLSGKSGSQSNGLFGNIDPRDSEAKQPEVTPHIFEVRSALEALTQPIA